MNNASVDNRRIAPQAPKNAPGSDFKGTSEQEDDNGKKTYSLTPHEKDSILEEWDYVCAYCFGPADQIDHVIPQAFKMDHSKENLVACCWLCNLIANDRVFRSFHQKQQYIIDRRYKFIQKHIIPLWLKDELRGMSYILKKDIQNSCLVLNSKEELINVKERLLKEGWKIAYNYEAVY